MKTITHVRDQKTYKRYSQFESTKRIIKSILKNRSLKAPIRWYIELKYQKQQKRSSLVRVKNKCLVTRRSRGFYRFAKASRFFLKDNNYLLSLPGLQKSKW